jgi:hypothetical protein
MGKSAHKHVYFSFVDVIDNDDGVFTESLVWQWHDHLLASFKEVFNIMKAKIDSISPISFFLNRALVEEVIADAIIGMKKVVDSGSHDVESPNAFKIASYLAYWWLRHKPVSIYYPADYDLEDVQIVDNGYENSADEQKKTVWKLKHINELVAVQIVVTYLFRFDKVLCGKKECNKVKKADENFCFSDFEEMKSEILQKLTYYFAYRAIAPKIIEHILEGYTFHPAWGLTGKLWTHREEKSEHVANEE